MHKGDVMRNDLRESFECNTNRYGRDMMTKSKSQTNKYRQRLIENGYAIVEARTREVGWLSYAPTLKLFHDIIDKYNTCSIFESMKCFNELADLNECSMGACGSKFNLYCHARNFQYDFSYTIDFKTHKTEWKFIPNEELPPYNGYKIKDLIDTELLSQENVGKVFKTKIRNGKWKLIDRFEDVGQTWLTLDDIIDREDIDEKRRFEFFGEDDYCYLISFEW